MHQRGFIALISITMLSVMLFLTTLSLAQFGLANRSFLLELEHKTKSMKLAEACVHIARILVYNNPKDETEMRSIPLSDNTCLILSISAEGEISTIRTQGTIRNAVTNLQVRVENESGDVLSWSEVSAF